MEKRDQVVRFMTRWLKREVPKDILTRFDALAHQHGCWVQMWEYPPETEWRCLFWLETQRDAGACDREKTFRGLALSDAKLYAWFLHESRE